MTTTLPTSPLGGAMPDRIQAAYEGHRQRLAPQVSAGARAKGQPGSRDAAITKLRNAGYLDTDDPTDAAIVAAVERLRVDRDAGRARTAEDSAYRALYHSTSTDPDANLTPEERALYAAMYPAGRTT